MTKDRRLGRGLAALLGTPADEQVVAPGDAGGGDRPANYASSGPSAAGPQRPTPPSRPALRVHRGEDDDELEAEVVVEQPMAGRSAAAPTSPTKPSNQPRTAEKVAKAARKEEREEKEKKEKDESPGEDLLQLNVYEIDDNPFQPRREFREEEIASLAESLKSHQMLQPVLVRRVAGRYQLISGERRLRAAIQAGWSTVPARLRDADDRLVAELAIVENLQRKDLNAIEKAMSFKRYLDQHGCTQEDLARRLKIDRSTIANLIRLLELPEEVIGSLRAETISAGHARALLPLGDEDLQRDFSRRIQSEGWSVRETERLVQERIELEDGSRSSVAGASSAAGAKKKSKSGQVSALEQELRMVVGTKVEIRQSSRGRGRIVIHFGGHDEFERLWAQLTDASGTSRAKSA